MYDSRMVISIPVNAANFAAGGNVTLDYPLPPGARRARVLDIVTRITTATVFATTAARVEVGRTGATDEFAVITIPTAQAAGVVYAARSTTAKKVLKKIYVAEEGNTAVLDALRVTLVPGTGAGLAGVGDVLIHVEIDYASPNDGQILA